MRAPRAMPRRRRRDERSGRLPGRRPGDCVVALGEREVPDLARRHPAEQRDHVVHPLDVGDHGDALPRPQVLGAHLEVLPQGTTGHALELTDNDDEPDLTAGRGALQRRQHNIAVVLGSQLARGLEPDNTVGQATQFLDHRNGSSSAPGPRPHTRLRFMDLFDLTGKTAVVTGGTRGIGLMIARGLLQAGASVYLSSRKPEAGEAAAAELSAHGQVVSVPADLAREEECVRLAIEVGHAEERVHVLVNNAGATWGAPLAEFPAAAWDRALDLNLKAPFYLTRAFLPLLEAAATTDDPGRVINIGSIDGLRVPELPTYSYSASKAGVHQLTRVLARELGPRHITVNAVAPGPFESKMMAATLAEFGDEIAASSPLGRIGRPDDMAGVAIFLSSRAGAYVTGAVIPVDGGIWTAH